jgi:hypothetical protein
LLKVSAQLANKRGLKKNILLKPNIIEIGKMLA